MSALSKVVQKQPWNPSIGQMSLMLCVHLFVSTFNAQAHLNVFVILLFTTIYIFQYII